MENQAGQRYQLLINDFNALHERIVYSEEFIIDLCKWKLMIFPKGKLDNDNVSLYLNVSKGESLSTGWRRRARFALILVNQKSEELSIRADHETWFDTNKLASGVPSMLSLTELHAENSGFIVNGRVRIDVEVTVLEVIGEPDVLAGSEEATQPLMEAKREDSSPERATITVNGFLVKPSQVDLVKHIYRKHPDIADKFIFKNENMLTGSMNFMISLIQTLRKPLEEVGKEDLAKADIAMRMVKSAGFKFEWMGKKLVEVKERKKEEEEIKARMHEMEKDMNKMKRKCSEIEPFLAREKAKKKEEQISRLDMIECEVVLRWYKRKIDDIEGVLELEKAKMLAVRTSPPWADFEL